MLKLGVSRFLPRRLAFALALLESSAPKINRTVGKSATGKSRDVIRADVLLFRGCVGEGLFSRVNRATKRVLEANGFAVRSPKTQVCCGALHAHAGDLEGARELARKNIAAFEEGDGTTSAVITNAGGCGAMLVSYSHLLADDEAFCERAREFSARVRDISQQLETTELRAGARATDEAVTYDASCHLLYGQHAGEAPLTMLTAVKGLNFVRLEGSERCCGGAGIYNLMEPDLSREVWNEKLFNIRATGAEVLATGNPGCQMQIGAGALLNGIRLRVCHPIELLDEAYERASVYERSDE
jgi:glycolate oxidase iron-sulfur subunit